MDIGEKGREEKRREAKGKRGEGGEGNLLHQEPKSVCATNLEAESVF